MCYVVIFADMSHNNLNYVLSKIFVCYSCYIIVLGLGPVHLRVNGCNFVLR